MSDPRLHEALREITQNPVLFRPDFSDWLCRNWALYVAFEREARRIATRRRHYGAATIIEFLRHQTLLADVDGEFKFNAKWTSSMARLFALLNPAMTNLFSYRERLLGVTPEMAA